ncbi:MAG: MFS transporter [Alphaproteobacteria bacterium]|nr:MFS transporter [Alphaproteobacteria bacterium]
MFQKFSDRIHNSDVDYRLLVPLLLCTTLVQVVTAMVRITTSYRAVELNLSIVWLGLIAATFAIVPIMLAVRIGRFIDHGHDAHTAWMGSAIFAAACAGFAVWSTPEGLLIWSTIMGTGHLMLMASQQMLCVRASTPRSMEKVFGNYMVAGAIGQGVGPYVVGWMGGAATLPPTETLFTAGAVLAIVSLAVALTMRPSAAPPAEAKDRKDVPVRELMRTPGLVTVIAAGVILVSSSDVILIYIPLLGAERGIDVRDIGLLLTVRAAASMVARIFYARMVGVFGRWPLMISTSFVCGATYAALAFPLPLWAMHLTLVIMGFTFGLAATLSITIIVDMTVAEARGTANSLRIMGNRMGQFALPFLAGLVAAAAGLAGLFAVLAGAIVAASSAMAWKRPNS